MQNSYDDNSLGIEWEADINNEEIVYNKLFQTRLKQFQDTKDKHSLLIISDFDYTMTKKQQDDNSLHCTYHFFDKSPILPVDFKKASRELVRQNDKYDNDPTIPIEERVKHLMKYYEDDLTLIANLGLTKEEMKHNFEVVFKERKFFFRKGAKAFFDILKQRHIPLIFISGGIKEVIHSSLHKLLGDDYNKEKLIHVISNEFSYDDQTTKTIEVTRPIMHTLNKKEFIDKHILGNYDLIKTNILFLGDNINDIDCLDNLHCPNLLSIAFSNEPTILEEYYQKYDMIITNDGAFTQVNNIILQLI